MSSANGDVTNLMGNIAWCLPSCVQPGSICECSKSVWSLIIAVSLKEIKSTEVIEEVSKVIYTKHVLCSLVSSSKSHLSVHQLGFGFIHSRILFNC